VPVPGKENHPMNPRLRPTTLRRAFAAAATLGLVLATAGLAAAQQARNLRLVTPQGERVNAVFPIFIHQVTARFDYLDASDTPITFIVFGPGGLRLMRVEDKYKGSGTAEVTITGKDLMRGVAATLVTNTQELQRSAAQATTAPRPRELLNGVEAAQLLIHNAEHLVAWSNLPPAGDSALDSLAAARGEIATLSARARLLGDDDTAGLHAIAAQMADPARRAVTAGASFEAAVKDFDAALMPTGSGTREAQAYVLSVQVEGQPAASAMMWVKTPIYLPFTQVRH
jgi:hypothetical protein